MLLESNYFMNAKIEISMIHGSSGQWLISIDFENNGNKYEKLSKDFLQNIFGFQCVPNIETETSFYWNTYPRDNDEYEIQIQFMNDKFYNNWNKFELIYWICDSIKKINEEITKKEIKNYE